MARKFRKGADTLNKATPYQDKFTVLDNDESWNLVEEGSQIVNQIDAKRPTVNALDDQRFQYYAGPIGDYLIMPIFVHEHAPELDKNYRFARFNQQLVVKLPEFGYRNVITELKPFSRYQMKEGYNNELSSLRDNNIILQDIFSEPNFVISPLLNKTPLELIKNPKKNLDNKFGHLFHSEHSEVISAGNTRNITNDQMSYCLYRRFPNRLDAIFNYYPVGEGSYIRFSNVFTFQAEGDVYFFKENRFYKLKMVNGVQCGSIFDPVVDATSEDPYGITSLSRDKVEKLVEDNPYLKREKVEEVTLTANEAKYRPLLASSDLTKKNTFPYRDLTSPSAFNAALNRDCLVLAEDEAFYSQKKEGFVVRTILTLRGRNPEDQILASTASQKHIFIDELGLIPVNDGKVVVNLKAGTITISGTVVNSAANQITPGTYSVSKTKKLNSLEDYVVNNDKNTRWFVPVNKPSVEYPIWNLGVYPIPQKLHYVPNERWCSLDQATNTITMLPMEFNHGMWKKFIKFQGGSENAGGIAYRDFDTFKRTFGTPLTNLIEKWLDFHDNVTTTIDHTWYPWIFKNSLNTFMPTITLNSQYLDPTYFIKTQGIRFNPIACSSSTKNEEAAEAKQVGIWKYVKRLEFVLDTTPFVEDEKTGEIILNAKEQIVISGASSLAYSITDSWWFTHYPIESFTDEQRLYFQFQFPLSKTLPYQEDYHEHAVLVARGLRELGLLGNDVNPDYPILPDMAFKYRDQLAGEDQEKKIDLVVNKMDYFNSHPMMTFTTNQLPLRWLALNHLPQATKDIVDKSQLIPIRRLGETTNVGYRFGFDRPHHEWAYAMIKKTMERMPANDEEIPRSFSYFKENRVATVENLSPRNKEKQKELFGRILSPYEWHYIYRATYGGADMPSTTTDEGRRLVSAIYLEKDKVVASYLMGVFGRFGVGFKDADDNDVKYWEVATLELPEDEENGTYKIKFKYDAILGINWPRNGLIAAGEYTCTKEDIKRFGTFFLRQGSKSHLVSFEGIKETNKNFISLAGAYAPGQRNTIDHVRPNMLIAETVSKVFDNNKFKIFGVRWEFQRGYPVKNRGDTDSVYHTPTNRRERHQHQPYLDWTGDPATSVFKYPSTIEMLPIPALTVLQTRKPEQADFWNKMLIHSRGSSNVFNQFGSTRVAFLHDERGMIIRPNATLADVMAKKPEAFFPPYHVIVENEGGFDETQHYLLGANQVAYFRKDLMADRLVPNSTHEIKISELRGMYLRDDTGDFLASTYKAFTFEPGDTLSKDEARVVFQTFTCPPSFFAEHFAENKNLNSYVEATEPTPTNQQKIWFYAMDSGYYVTEVFDLTGVGYQNLDIITSGLNVRYIDDGKDNDNMNRLDNKIWLSKMGGIQMGSGFTIDITKRQEYVCGLSFKEQVKRFNHYGVSIVPGPANDLKEVNDYWQSYFGRK